MGKEDYKNREIKNILLVLGTAIFCAGLLALVFIYYYGPSGHYLAGHTILDPTIMEQIKIEDKHPQTGRKLHLIFDHIAFSYFDPQKDQMRQQIIPLETYRTFYRLIVSEKSLEDVSANVKNLFLNARPAELTIHMRAFEDSDMVTNQVFQSVQFVQANYFRVQLHDNPEQKEWIYFYRPQIYQEAMKLFTEQ